MENKYNWDFGIAAPKNYPIQISEAFVYFGDKKQIYPSAGIFAGTGLASVAQTSESSLNEYKRTLPEGIYAIWVSRVERKVYKIETEFSPNLKMRLKQLAENKLYESIEKDSTVFTDDEFLIVATLLPGGDVMLNIKYDGMNAFVEMLHGKEIVASIKDLNLAYHEGESDEVYYSFCEKEFESPMKSILTPYGLWIKYCERFEYDINVDFEDKTSVLIEDTHVIFTNAENIPLSKKFPSKKARVKQLYLLWYNKNIEYNAYIYLNENEVLKLFDAAYSDKVEEPGKFVVRVSKYNNWFDIYLIVNDKEYKFENTQIHVWKYISENGKVKEELHYWNYRNKDVEQYIGE